LAPVCIVISGNIGHKEKTRCEYRKQEIPGCFLFMGPVNPKFWDDEKQIQAPGRW